MGWIELEIPDIPEVTDEVRERWHRLLETTPTQGFNLSNGILISELLGSNDGPFLKKKKASV